MKKILLTIILVSCFVIIFLALREKAVTSVNIASIRGNKLLAEVNKAEVETPKITEFPTLLPDKSATDIVIYPASIIQGEPIMIQVDGATLADIKKIYFNDESLWFWHYENKPSALVPIDLNQKPGKYKITVKLEDGKIVEKLVNITAREKIVEPLGIPQKLGGNTPQAATNLVTNLTKENAVINNAKSALKRFWSEKFIYPVANPVVTDDYGYLRKTGYYAIPHKGADFRAVEGTPVLAMNRGIVRLATESTIYGKTVAVDHGFGVITYYMHLSKINVAVGALVSKSQTIALSGQTGYAEVPHLHLSVKINGISIDPVGFLELFK